MSAVALNRITIALGFIGIFIAGYLSLGHILNIALPCGVSHGCDIVATHPSSYLTGDPIHGGIPVAYLGFVGYLILTALAIFRTLGSQAMARPLVWFGFIISAIGAGYSGFLTYIALYEIHATCIWCLASAGTMVLTTIVYAAMLQMDAPNADATEKSKPDTVLALAFFAVTVVALGLGVVQLKASGATLDPGFVNVIQKGEVNLVGKDSHILGQSDAPVTVVEFADLLCPACQSAFPTVEGTIQKSGGKARLVFHHFPLFMKPDHKMAMPAATIAEIASEEGKFWDYISAIYLKQNADLQTPESILAVAKSVGLDVDKIQKRLEDENDPALKRVTEDINLSNKLKISSTPTLIIVAEGVRPKQVLPADLESVLSQEPYKSIMEKGAATASK